MSKQEVRKQIKERLAALSPEALKAESDKLCTKILESDLFKRCTTLLAYMPLADEVDISPVIQTALSRRKKVFLPKILPGTNQMEFYRYDNESIIEKGEYGIEEPAADKTQSFTKFLEWLAIQQYSPAAHSSEYVDIAEHDQPPEHILILVPGRAFSKDGHRLGRGKGFYDIYLSQIPQIFDIKKSGVCFACQLLANIPTTPDDVLMDTVVSTSSTTAHPISEE